MQLPEEVEDAICNVQKWLAPKISEMWRKSKQSATNNRRYDLGELHAEEEPHISLTKVGVTLQFHWINEFTNSMRNAFHNMKKLYVSFGKIQVYFNETKTRIFIGNYTLYTTEYMRPREQIKL